MESMEFFNGKADSMGNPVGKRHALTGQIEILGRTNAHVHAALHQFRSGACEYVEAMQMIVLQLAAVVESQQNTIIEFAKRQPAPYIGRSAP